MGAKIKAFNLYIQIFLEPLTILFFTAFNSIPPVTFAYAVSICGINYLAVTITLTLEEIAATEFKNQ
jgi:hypothetical protein